MSKALAALDWNYSTNALFRRAAQQYFPSLSADVANYMIHCSVSPRFVYVETPKVASSTVNQVIQLIEVGGDSELLASMGGNMHDRNQSPIPSLTHNGVTLDEALGHPRFFRFTFVRNPFTPVVSAYLNKIKSDSQGWAQYLGMDSHREHRLVDYLLGLQRAGSLETDSHWMPQAELLVPKMVSYDVIGRFEQLDRDLKAVVTRLTPNLATLTRSRVDYHLGGLPSLRLQPRPQGRR